MDIGILGVVVSAVGVGLAILIYFLQSKKRELSWDILSGNKIVTSKEDIEGKLKVLYEGREVHDVHLLEIKIMNSGDIGIPLEDYEQPITFSFPVEAEVLSAEIIERSPENLKSSVTCYENILVISPALLNSKDYWIMKVLVTGYKENQVIVEARIKDVKDFKKGKTLEINHDKISNALLNIIFYSCGLSFFIFLIYDLINSISSAGDYVLLFWFIIFAIIMLIGALKGVKNIFK